MNPARVEERRQEDLRTWALVKDLPEIHTRAVREMTGVSSRRAAEMIRSWEARGMIHEVRMDKNLRVFATGSRANVLDLRRQEIADQLTDDPRANMWRAMYLLKSFTPIDIVGVSNLPKAPVSEAEAERYCQTLLKGEYLRVLEKARPGFRPATYLLARRTGPIPPTEKRVRALWDENLGAFTYAAGVGVLS